MKAWVVAILTFFFAPLVFASAIDLSHSQFDEKINANPEAVIIDVRSPREFSQGRVPNSINIPHGDILDDLSLLDEYQGKELVFYCRSGYRAGRVTDLIKAKNYGQGISIYHLDGDMLGWEAANKPIEK